MTKKKFNKIYVPDTNIIYNNWATALIVSEENLVVIPAKVIEELDNHKSKGKENSFHARSFIRVLDAITSQEGAFNGGVPTIFEENDYKGLISIRKSSIHPKIVEDGLDPKKNDHLIISTALHMKDEHPDKEVILLSMDINVRTIARMFGLRAEEPHHEAANLDSLDYKGIRPLTKDEEVNLYQSCKNGGGEYLKGDFIAKMNLKINEYLTSGGKLYVYEGGNILHHVNSSKKKNLKGKNIEQRAAIHSLLDPRKKLVILSGPAGTGKTYLATAAAIEEYLGTKRIHSEIMIARREISVEDNLGFLPGNLDDKIAPYLAGFFDNIKVLKKTNKNREKKIEEAEQNIQKVSVSFFRGRSISDTFMIIDEAQNLTPHQMKTILTRIGENTKIILMGDLGQIDDKFLSRVNNGLAFVIDRMVDDEMTSFVTLKNVERSSFAAFADERLN